MTILHETCVISVLEQNDPWRTERRSSGWMVGDAPPVESDTPQPAADLWKTERPRSDWSIGDLPGEAVETMRLALVPVQSGRSPVGRTDAIVAGALTQQRITELLLSDDGSPPADRAVAQGQAHRALVID
jgi:hypothetical protein